MQETIEVKGLSERLEKEHQWRAFGAVARVYYVRNFVVSPLTPRVVAELRIAGSPLFGGGEVTLEACLDLLWRLSPAYAQPHEMTWRAMWRRFKLIRAVQRTDGPRLIKAVQEFISVQLQDSPRPKPQAGAPSAGLEKEAAYWVIHNGCEFIRVFGGSIQAYLDTPCPVLNQMWRWHLKDRGDGGAISNTSDELCEEAVMEYIASRELQAARENS